MSREPYKICRSDVEATTSQVKEYCDKLMIIKEMFLGDDTFDLVRGITTRLMIAAAIVVGCVFILRDSGRDIITLLVLIGFSVVPAYFISTAGAEVRQLIQLKRARKKLVEALEETGLSGTLEMELIIGAYALYEAEADEACISEISGIFRLYNDEAGVWLTDDKDIAVMADDRYQISRKLLRGKEIDLSGLQKEIDKVRYVVNCIVAE